ncbi:GNAT family N-acetyltransferase [Endozoicomonas arenosclerae]|uniref:GNAT family N-acetyltransferase n=1 Tax=Endozoicomonas arenosclerae TaxID=1633495 RepID=UPI0007861C0E|nr:GNAT family N-acetyltransferase [Endozoicomonas arenosclerae]
MKNSLNLNAVNKLAELDQFWTLFDVYINELAANASQGDEFDLEYFYSDAHRGDITFLLQREKNPIRIHFFEEGEVILGFIMYMTNFDEDNMCYLMEYYIKPEYRTQGYGRQFYEKSEAHIKDEGALNIELTPTNDKNAEFWTGLGFVKSDDRDEDNKFFYRKSLQGE